MFGLEKKISPLAALKCKFVWDQRFCRAICYRLEGYVQSYSVKAEEDDTGFMRFLFESIERVDGSESPYWWSSTVPCLDHVSPTKKHRPQEASFVDMCR